MDPRQLPIVQLENIRNRSSIGQKDFSGTLVTAGAVTSVGFEIQKCETHPEMWLRIQAFYSCVCLVMFSVNDWFTLETCEAFCYQLFNYINFQTNQQSPCLDGLKMAHLQTLTEFANEIHSAGRTLEELIREKACWTPYWKDIPTADGRPSKRSAPGAELSNDGLPPAIMNSINQSNQLVRTLQGQLDRALKGGLKTEVTKTTEVDDGANGGGKNGKKGGGRKRPGGQARRVSQKKK